MSDSDLSALAADAYVYGYPLVFDIDEILRISEHGLGAMPPVPPNTLVHGRALADASAKFVSVNNDTLYTMISLDLSGGPLVLRVPDTDDRYYVLQFIDAWTNNFAYIGRRATGTAAGTFLIVPPGSTVEPSGGERVIQAPTKIANVVGRIACAGVDDLEAVYALQAGFSLTSVDPAVPLAGVPAPAEVPEELAFWERMRTWMQAFPPSAPDTAYQERFAPLGLLEWDSPYADAAPELHEALVAGFAAGKARIEEHGLGGATVNGWGGAMHTFDYNDNFFEVGTLSAPEWRIADRAVAFATRAVAARQGLWGNHGYEAFYAGVFTDADGGRLNGANRYVLRFDEQPPVDAFWSITMYDASDYFLVPNAIDRYSIGDRTPGLVQGADGSLTIVLQAEEPVTPEERANWLPTPRGDFRPLLRAYQPGAAILDGTYRLPPIERVG